jgi:serine/threonine protein kinase
MEDNRLYIQTELCTSTLHGEMMAGTIDEKRIFKLLREILLALDMIHKAGMVHLDIKVRAIRSTHTELWNCI